MSFWKVGKAAAPETANRTVPNDRKNVLAEAGAHEVAPAADVSTFIDDPTVIKTLLTAVPPIAITATGQKSAGEPKKVSGSKIKPMIMIQSQNLM